MKKVLPIIVSITLLFSVNMSVFAAEKTSSEQLDTNISVIITDNKTGLELSVPLNNVDNNITIQDDSSITEETTATFSIPETGIRPLYSDTSTTNTDVKATIKINYDRNGNKIRVNSVSGSWVPSSSLIYINNREVHYGDGVPFGGHSSHKYPSSNSFNYTTGWGWVNWYPASADATSGARAYSCATVSVSGMTSHTIEVSVTANH